MMDKHTQAELVWGFFLFFCFLAFWSNCKAWATGEVICGRSFTSRKITREENPQSFQRYMIGMFITLAVGSLVE